MKKSRKFLKVAFALMVSVTMLLSGLSLSLNAQESQNDNKVNITVHKRLFKNKPEDKVNTGNIMDDFGGEPLQGVEFSVYNVTAEYNTGLKTNEASKVISDLVTKFSGDYDNKLFISGITGVDGEVSFDLDRKSDGQMQVYAIVETKLPTNVSITEKAAPMIIALPIYTVETGGNAPVENKDIHLYPKNISPINTKVFKDTGLTLIGDDEDGHKDFTIDANQKLDFEVKLHIPNNAHLGFSYIDKHEGLELQEKIEIEGLTVVEDYTVDANKNGEFTIKFNTESQNFNDLIGEEISITYSMKLKSGFEVDKLYTNRGYTQIGNVENDKVEVAYKVNEEDKLAGFSTSGHQFLKTDGRTDDVLENAQFIIKGTDGYAKFNDNLEFIEWTDNKGEATKLVSGSDPLSNFSFKGLKRGEYTLEEVEAPDGYVLMDDLIFNVSADTKATIVKNFKKGILPSTGGKGIYGFLFLGTVLMGGSYLMLRKSKTKSKV